MSLKLIAAILLIAAVPGWALAQSAVTDENEQHETISGDKTQTKAPSAATGADKTQAPSAASDENARQEAIHQAISEHAQAGFEAISGDKVQTKAYCDIVKLHDEIKQAYKKGDLKSVAVMGQQERVLQKEIDPKAHWLMGAKFSDKNLLGQLGVKPDETMEANIAQLDGLCASAQQEPDGHAGSDQSGNAGSEDRSGKADDNRE